MVLVVLVIRGRMVMCMLSGIRHARAHIGVIGTGQDGSVVLLLRMGHRGLLKHCWCGGGRGDYVVDACLQRRNQLANSWEYIAFGKR